MFLARGERKILCLSSGVIVGSQYGVVLFYFELMLIPRIAANPLIIPQTKKNLNKIFIIY